MGAFLQKERLKNLFLLIAGSALTALATVVCFTPNRIVCGGVSGISTILFHAFHLPIGFTYAAINLLLLLAGIKILGKEFILKTLLGTALVSVFMELLVFLPPLTADHMLAALFGGVFYGVGMGLTFIAKGSTGGTDILGRLIQHFIPSLSIGKLLAVIDASIILASIIAFRELDLVLFGIVGIVLQSIAVDSLIDRFNAAHMVFIVTDRAAEVREYLRTKYDRGVTELEAYGYANEEKSKQLLVCVLNAREAANFKEHLQQVDSEAFVMFSEAKSILGKGFRYYQ